MRRLFVATKDIPIGTKITAEVAASFERQSFESHEILGIAGKRGANPSKRIGCYIFAKLNAGEILLAKHVKKRKPRFPAYRVGQKVVLMKNVRIPWDRGFTVTRGAEWLIESVDSDENLIRSPLYTLSIGIGGKEPIGRTTVTEKQMREIKR